MPVPVTTDATFAQDVLASDLPVLVEFTAAWCAPCRMIAPVLDQIAGDEAGRLSIVSLDVDANPETTRRYAVMSMPTLALFVGGAVVSQVVGARPRAAIVRELEPHLPAVLRG
jgi:thioredoxin 1